MSRDIRGRLASIGLTRERLNRETKKLARETESAILDARKAGVSMTEIAELVKLDRTNLYHTYRKVKHRAK